MSSAEYVASIIDCNLSQRKYIKLGRRMKKRGGRSFQPYSKVQQYRDFRCTPRNINTDKESVIYVSLQDAMDHQAGKILQLKPEVIERMERLKRLGASFKLYFKYGKTVLVSTSTYLPTTYKINVYEQELLYYV